MSAFEILSQYKMDFAILDYNLPELTGSEFLRILRNSEDLPTTLPVIACTSDTRRSVLNEFVAAGVDEVLTKPVSADEAWKKISAIVNRRRNFVRTNVYFGPDRRRKEAAHLGMERREY